MKCIFCRSILKSTEAPEHILLNALGGRKTTTKVVCTSCNHKFGRTIDDALAKSVATLRNIGNFPSGDGREPPKSSHHTQGNLDFDLTAGFNPRPHIKDALQFKSLPDGGHSVSILARDQEHLEVLISNIAKKIGITEEAVRDQLRSTSFVLRSEPIAPIEINQSFGDIESQRSMAKACLVLWSLKFGNDELLAPHFADSIKFVTSGNTDGTFQSELDTRSLPSSASGFAAFPNIIWVGSDQQGRTIGYFRLYGIMGWSFVLSTESSVKNECSFLISDPAVPENWSEGDLINSPLDINWISTPSWVQDEIEKSHNSLLIYSREKSKEVMFAKIFADAGAYFGLGIDDPISQEIFSDYVKYLSCRLAHAALQMPHEMVLPGMLK